MADDYYDYEEGEAAPKKHDNLFLWTVFILLLIGIAFACWLGSFYIFGHPEQPWAYALLEKFKKTQLPKRFEDTAAPPGEFLTAQKLFERYSSFSPLQLEKENAELLRTFVTNYRETKKLVPYVRGNFTITSSAPLTPQNFMKRGMVALAQSNDFPQVLIEHLYPMNADNAARSRRLLVEGNPIKLEKTRDLGAVIHIAKIPEGRMQFTVVPLLYGGYGLTGGEGTFSTQPPLELNLAGGLPVLRGPQVAESMKTFAAFRRAQPLPESTAPGESAPALKGPEIVRLDAPEGLKIPETGQLPEMPVATPIPIAGRNPATPRKVAEVAQLDPTPRPMRVATPLPMTSRPPVATPLPTVAMATTPAPNLPPGVLKPFIESNAPPGLPGPQGNQWRTYRPGALPTGRVIGTGDARQLADRGRLGDRNYLRGDFVVKVSSENRAVIRPRLANGEADPEVRILVEYPNGSVPPPEGSTVARDETMPYQITDVRRAADGELNIWVREIVQP